MIRVELNIGLKRNLDGMLNSARGIESAVAYNRDVSVVRFREANSETEPTLVCQFVWLGAPSAFRSWVRALSLQFAQDCIAAYYVQDGAGELIGPKAAEWGNFNMKFFIRYDEKVLDAVQQQ